MIAVIRGTGSYIPPRVVENEELKNYIETNDTWIRERTGIERRHVVTDDTVASMAVEAGKSSIENAGIQAESLELIIVSTTSPTQMIPCNACLVQKELGAVKAACFDLNAACSGFITAYQTACAYIESGFYQKILVIGSEALSCITDWSDRSTCILFGDGAGAVVLTAEAGEKQVSVCGADGRMGDALTLYSGYSSNPFGTQEPMQRAAVDDSGKNACVRMDGQAIFRFAVRKVPQLIEELLQKNSLQKEDIKYYILHQANERIVEAVAKEQDNRSKIPDECTGVWKYFFCFCSDFIGRALSGWQSKSRRQAGDRRIRRRADLGSQCCDMAVGRWKRRIKCRQK